MELSHVKCPVPSCSSSDAFSYNQSTKTGYCHSCATAYPSKGINYKDWVYEAYPLQFKPGSSGSIEETTTKMHHPPSATYVPCRGITEKTMKTYDVKTVVDAKGDPTSQVYTYPSGVTKTRYWPKSFSSSGKIDELFGMNKWTSGCAKVVTVTEGELDAMSAYQIISGNSYSNPVVSFPSATPSRALWEKCVPWLDGFDKIVVSVDGDDAGDALASKIHQLFPNKTYRVDHSRFKDANEFLTSGAANEYKQAWWNAKKYTPDNVLNTSDQFLKLYRESPAHQYVPTGIQGLDDKIMGLMQGHFTVIKAATGVGKSEMMRMLEYRLWSQGVPFACWHLEETKLRSLLGLVSYHVNQNLTRQDIIEQLGLNSLVEEAIEDLTKDENIFQFYMQDHQGADDLIDIIRFFATACDVRYIFFEPIQDVISGNEESKEATLSDLSVRLSKLAAELNVGIVTIAHTNDNGDTKYCKMIGQRASVILDIHRDKEAEDPIERNTTYITVEKNRPCAEVGSGGKLRFDSDSFTLKEIL